MMQGAVEYRSFQLNLSVRQLNYDRQTSFLTHSLHYARSNNIYRSLVSNHDLVLLEHH